VARPGRDSITRSRTRPSRSIIPRIVVLFSRNCIAAEWDSCLCRGLPPYEVSSTSTLPFNCESPWSFINSLRILLNMRHAVL
jgi:hypothetical protein